MMKFMVIGLLVQSTYQGSAVLGNMCTTSPTILGHALNGTTCLFGLMEPPISILTSRSGEVKDVMPMTCADLKITVVYDNNSYDSRLTAAWGFAALIEYRSQTILFDTGGHSQTLLHNMAILGIDPTHIQTVVLSHYHGDHTGGLDGLLARGARPTVYLLSCFPSYFKDYASHMATVIEVAPGQSIAGGAFTTGAMDTNSIREQALVLKTDRGLVVVAGCAHPGIAQIVERAKTLFGRPIHLVMGGFHLGSRSADELKAVLLEFRRLGVEKVAPMHCTGKRAVEMFKSEYGENFIEAGVGRVIKFEP